MTEINTEQLVKNLISTFLDAGEISINLRNKGLTKKIKSDNTPVSNGDIEVNKLITKKISEITPDIPIISEETSDNKDNNNLKNFWLVDPIDGTYDYINTPKTALIKIKDPKEYFQKLIIHNNLSGYRDYYN